MTTALGSGTFTFEVVEGWAKLPQGWSFKECPDVAVDSKDRVYAFTRGEHGVIVFDRDGNFLSSWGVGIFGNAHGICIGPDDTVYCVDNGDHTVRKFSTDGELLMTLGTKDQPAPRFSGEAFNLPTGLAVSHKTGDLFISDGYGNARVHKYNAEGRHIMSWGSSGIDEGQFVIPHNIAVDRDDNVYVADRECHRVQVFDPNGRLQAIWSNIWKPSGIRVGVDGNVYIAELLADSYYADAPDVGHRVSIYSQSGKLLGRLGDSQWGEGPGQFVSPHGIALDSRGDIYVGEVSWTMMGRILEPPRELRSLQKLARTA
ncbi:MAG: peptidyl-alpha-hydroxyglycine alpha-amidating lyase family protein [Chloroflexi bacterium]|nr:peptidyl-alpha-hydroxyglycine alpha-amidating lyase family protein [Chloroflexota bacterium]